jgi:hypothetical protein
MTTTRIKRPRDPIQLAKLVGDIATGLVVETPPPTEPPKGRAGGIKGGIARAQNLSKARRVEIAKKAAKTRWRKISEPVD